MDNSTTLQISNDFNDWISNRTIGSIVNKNVGIRNYLFSRNIGKYPLYNIPLFPEVGMVYNVYEHLLNKPVRHYVDDDSSWGQSNGSAINGLIKYNNDIKTSIDGNVTSTDDAFKNVDAGDTEGETIKQVYVTNSGSLGLEGGYGLLSNVKANLDEYVKNRIKNPYITSKLGQNTVEANFAGYSIDNPTFQVNGENLDDGFDIETLGKNFAYNEANISFDGDTDILSNFANQEDSSDIDKDLYDGISVNYSDSSSVDLLSKTNALFQEGRIKSLVNRFQTQDGISRGRALLKKDRSAGRSQFDNPFCRVWTQTSQYRKVKDMIRPWMSEGKFMTLEEVQANTLYDGLRNRDALTKLSSRTPLLPNGFVQFSPYRDKNGEYNEDSIKRCMFSIENLAWKDVKNNNGSASTSYYSTLSKEQKGPNNGRIMWFPPYNIKFSEQVQARWNNNSFIGRGEDVYTYTNTERGGQLSFTILVDHPSVINAWRRENTTDSDEKEADILRFFAGCENLGDDETVKAKNESINQEESPKQTPKEEDKGTTLSFITFFPNNYSGKDDGTDFVKFLYGSEGNGKVTRGYELLEGDGNTLITPIEQEGSKRFQWTYIIDDNYKGSQLSRYKRDDKYYTYINGVETEVSDDDLKVANNIDRSSSGLNCLKQLKYIKKLGIDTDKIGDTLFSFGDFATAFGNVGKINGAYNESNVEKLTNIFQNNSKNITSVHCKGFASSHGTGEDNTALSIDRANSVLNWIKNIQGVNQEAEFKAENGGVFQLSEDNINVSYIESKIARCVISEITFGGKNDDTIENATTNGVLETQGIDITYENMLEPAIVTASTKEYTKNITAITTSYTAYDEYKYFQAMSEEETFMHSKTIEKIKYFDPAFHSITPEGFNARLTFLHQCTRQGPTPDSLQARNMAFGRAPYCILRIGDFYNTKIIIESVNIDYGDQQWDMNPEGIGIQPMLANVQISFKFIGGSDIEGPINQLQNAVSFNYYSNTSVYHVANKENNE